MSTVEVPFSFLSSFVVTYISVLVVPGPNFLVVSSAGLRSRAAALWAASGVACGGLVAATVAAASVYALPQMSGLRAFGTVIFCLFMARSAFGLLGPARPPTEEQSTQATASSYLLGFGAAALNPLTIAFLVSLFLSQPTPLTMGMMASAGVAIFVLASLWFSFVGIVVARSAGAIEGQVGLRPVRLAMAFVIAVITLHAAAGIMVV